MMSPCCSGIYRIIGEAHAAYWESTNGATRIALNDANSNILLEQRVPWSGSASDSIEGFNNDFMQQLIMVLLSQERGIRLKTRSLVGKSFPNTFSGTELVDWLEDKEGVPTSVAMKVGQKLLDAHYISHSSTDLLPFTKACWYTFTNNAYALV